MLVWYPCVHFLSNEYSQSNSVQSPTKGISSHSLPWGAWAQGDALNAVPTACRVAEAAATREKLDWSPSDARGTLPISQCVQVNGSKRIILEIIFLCDIDTYFLCVIDTYFEKYILKKCQ